MIIRELDAQDIEGFLALEEQGLASDSDAFVASIGDDLPSYPEVVRERLAKASIESGDIVLGAFSPDLIGIIAITRDKRAKRYHKADLHGMYVVPGHRGKGIGKALLIQSLDMARQMEGLEEIQLIVATQNHAAVALYERFGFRRAWTEYHALKVEEHYIDAHHMILPLAEPCHLY